MSKAVTLVMNIRLYETKSVSLVSLGSSAQFNITWIFKCAVARYYRLTCSEFSPPLHMLSCVLDCMSSAYCSHPAEFFS